ncbi:MAG: hypothetical protein HC904_02700 [Blastochloris sp.]|nr:hypothetical protein [Blastochloris sp.]
MNHILSLAEIMIILAILAGFWRLVKGPSVFDRILAFDLIAVSSVGLMVILSIEWHTTLFLELILLFSLLGFVGTVALTYYLGKKPNQEKTNDHQPAHRHPPAQRRLLHPPGRHRPDSSPGHLLPLPRHR